MNKIFIVSDNGIENKGFYSNYNSVLTEPAIIDVKIKLEIDKDFSTRPENNFLTENFPCSKVISHENYNINSSGIDGPDLNNNFSGIFIPLAVKPGIEIIARNGLIFLSYQTILVGEYPNYEL
jgi:hypothetical protein